MQDAMAQFAIRLLAGIGLFLLVMPRKDVPSPFFRIMCLVELGLAGLYTLTVPETKLPAIVLAVLAFAGSACWLLERRGAGTVILAANFLVALAELVRLALLAAHAPLAGANLPESFAFLLFSWMAAAGTLGGAMTGMLLGHRYLTAPGMPLARLERVNSAFGIAAIFRLLVSAWGLMRLDAALSSASSSAPTLTSHAVWLALRWLAGVIGPIAVWFLVRRILKYKNTQSATGVLFVGVILTLIGELTADLLLRSLGRAL
jgi:hypothetical protein